MRGVDRLQRPFDLKRGFARRRARPIGDTKDARVDRDRRFAEGDTEHNVGGLAPDAGERLQPDAVAASVRAMPLKGDFVNARTTSENPYSVAIHALHTLADAAEQSRETPVSFRRRHCFIHVNPLLKSR
jgi:hypothetical protein